MAGFIPEKQVKAIFQAVDRQIVRRIDEHVEDYHVPLPGVRYDIPEEVPFQEEHIPDPILRRMYERLSRGNDVNNNEDVSTVSRDFGYPEPLVERELFRYVGANGRFNRMLRG